MDAQDPAVQLQRREEGQGFAETGLGADRGRGGHEESVGEAHGCVVITEREMTYSWGSGFLRKAASTNHRIFFSSDITLFIVEQVSSAIIVSYISEYSPAFVDHI